MIGGTGESEAALTQYSGDSLTKGLKVFTSDGEPAGTITDPKIRAELGAAGFEPEGAVAQETPSEGAGVGVGLHLMDDAPPLAGTQPTQADLGVEPPTPSDIAVQDVGTDYKRTGDAGDPSAPTTDALQPEDYFQVATGFQNPDLYLPYSSVSEVREDGVHIRLDRSQIVDVRWQRRPAG